jgi:hypothetical protein
MSFEAWLDPSTWMQPRSAMSKLRCHISISLDGFVAGPNQSEEYPLGEGGERLHDWVVELGAWREAHDKEGGEVNASGVLAAQSRAHTWPGARRAILCYSALPLGQWGDPWPASWPTGVGPQLHITEGDEDHEIAQTLAATVPNAELFVYPGEAHYFAEHKPPRYSTDAPSTTSRRS